MPCRKNLRIERGAHKKIKIKWVIVGGEPQQMVTYWEEPIISEFKRE
jgi:hypothetical protein